MTDDELLKEIDAQRLLMIAVSTGRGSIDGYNEEYIERRDLIRAGLRERALEDPNTNEDLWAWYGKWSSGDLPKYQQRREYISALYKPLTDAIRSGGRVALLPEPTGWAKVDAIRRDTAVRVAQAKSEHDYQGVGHLCRELLIALVDAVYDPARHPPIDATVPSKTDAKRKLDAYLAVELPGSGNEEARRMAKAAIDLANAVQHRQGATLRDAALAAEATNAVINIVAIIAGRRDKPLESIREELAERLARAEVAAASWKEKYQAAVGFSAFVTLEGDVPGDTYVCIAATQDVEILALDYCLANGVRIVSAPFDSLHGRDVRVPVNHSYVDLTFRRGFTGSGPHKVEIALRVKMRAGDALAERQIVARVEQDVASGVLRLLG